MEFFAAAKKCLSFCTFFYFQISALSLYQFPSLYYGDRNAFDRNRDLKTNQHFKMRKTVAAGIGFGVGFCLGVGAFKLENSVPTVAVIRLAGQISEGPSFGAPRINFQSFSKLIDRSFRFKNLKAVCLRINSPGGSPVQSELIAKRFHVVD